MSTAKASGNDAAIAIEALSSRYGSHRVLFDLDLTIARHRVTVIMGVSGCGKSTLLRHLVGLKPVESGRVLVDGRSLASFNRSEMQAYRRRIGVLFQNGALFSSLSVAENIAVPLRVHTRLADSTIGIIAEIKLHQVGLSGFGHYMPSQLSGGMRKRAGLARALAMDPEFLFVDEPSSGLDPITAAGLDELILELRDALGMTLVVVTHELESAFRIADHLVVLDRGRVLAQGPAADIRAGTDPRIVQFLNRCPDQAALDQESYLRRLLAPGGR